MLAGILQVCALEINKLESEFPSGSSDVWAFGILLVEIVQYGRKPYKGMANREVVSLLEKNRILPQRSIFGESDVVQE